MKEKLLLSLLLILLFCHSVTLVHIFLHTKQTINNIYNTRRKNTKNNNNQYNTRYKILHILKKPTHYKHSTHTHTRTNTFIHTYTYYKTSEYKNNTRFTPNNIVKVQSSTLSTVILIYMVCLSTRTPNIQWFTIHVLTTVNLSAMTHCSLLAKTFCVS
jgi:hypothetical protein